MKIYAIGDLHLSGKPPSKPMEIFGKHWTDHAAKVAANWHQLIRSDDTVIICGDTSWAMDLQDALTDLNWIAALPGRKIILRGNHDYWWASLKKMQTATEQGKSMGDVIKECVPAPVIAAIGAFAAVLAVVSVAAVAT